MCRPLLSFLRTKPQNTHTVEMPLAPNGGNLRNVSDQNRDSTEFAEIVLKNFIDAYLRKIYVRDSKYLDNKAHVPFCR